MFEFTDSIVGGVVGVIGIAALAKRRVMRIVKEGKDVKREVDIFIDMARKSGGAIKEQSDIVQKEFKEFLDAIGKVF